MKSQLSVVTLFSQIQRHKEYLKVTTKGGTSHFQVIVEVKSQIMENCIFLNKIINFKKGQISVQLMKIKMFTLVYVVTLFKDQKC